MERYLAFDMGGSSIKYGLLTKDGEIIKNSSFKTPKTLEELYKNIVDIKNQYEQDKIIGVALSCPGAVNSEVGTIGGVSAIPYIHGPNIKKDLEELLGVDVELENDANCAALAEVWLGEAKENQDVVFIVIGTGIGGAIVKDRKIHKGKHLHAGEFGIMYFESEPGVPGTWGVASMGSLVLRLSKKLEREVDGIEIFRLADQEKNEIVLEELDRWYSNLAKGIFTIQYVYDPEKIVIGGGISARPEILLEIRKKLEELISKIDVATIHPDIQVCKFSNSANLIGALYNFLQQKGRV